MSIFMFIGSFLFGRLIWAMVVLGKLYCPRGRKLWAEGIEKQVVLPTLEGIVGRGKCEVSYIARVAGYEWAEGSEKQVVLPTRKEIVGRGK